MSMWTDEQLHGWMVYFFGFPFSWENVPKYDSFSNSEAEPPNLQTVIFTPVAL